MKCGTLTSRTPATRKTEMPITNTRHLIYKRSGLSILLPTLQIRNNSAREPHHCGCKFTHQVAEIFHFFQLRWFAIVCKTAKLPPNATGHFAPQQQTWRSNHQAQDPTKQGSWLGLLYIYLQTCRTQNPATTTQADMHQLTRRPRLSCDLRRVIQQIEVMRVGRHAHH